MSNANHIEAYHNPLGSLLPTSNATIDIRLRVWALLEAVEQGDIQEVQRLVDVEGVPITGPNVGLLGHNFYGFTPLLYAAKGGHIPIMAWLLSKGSSLVEEDIWGKNAMHHAIEHKQIPALQYLLEVEGASIRGCDKLVANTSKPHIITVWRAIRPCFTPHSHDCHKIPEFDVPLHIALESLLKVMVMHENAPYDFRWGLPEGVLPNICELGRLNRPYLEQQRVAIGEGLPLSVVVLQQIVAEYARISPEDMWAEGVVLSTGLPLVPTDVPAPPWTDPVQPLVAGRLSCVSALADWVDPFQEPATRLTRVVQKRGLEEGGSASPAPRRSQRLRNISKSD
jgi:hypothetical protein